MIAVCGAGQCDSGTAALAEMVGRSVAAAGATLVCGGLGGVMAAACRGARGAGGTTVGILPGNDAAAANPDVQVPIATGIGEARNAIIVCSADVVIAIGGEYGTLSEIALARKLGRPVIGLRTWNLGRDDAGEPHVLAVNSPEAAVAAALSYCKRR
ncbi:MAG TPA: TIGR00725 family protein [Kouleothrix sp.]|uniref:TIGR00725 family protein n=1 Tax=Kouleothrix sp. TaxID=2779161 RepID=UPI002CF316C7|nr:TIGR00725 family protein [Kouleothrix sp.]